MPFCKYCGKELEDDAFFCPSCGKEVAKKEAEKFAAQRSDSQPQDNNCRNLTAQAQDALENEKFRGIRTIAAGLAGGTAFILSHILLYDVIQEWAGSWQVYLLATLGLDILLCVVLYRIFCKIIMNLTQK